MPRGVAALALVASLFFLYRAVLVKLAHDWATDDNYSHGFLIPPLAIYLVWERRYRLASLAPAPSALGLMTILGSLALLAAGVLGAELFLMRVSLVGVVVGVVLFLGGRPYLRVLAFPISVLLLMIPLPALVFNQIAFPLQLLASAAGSAALSAFGVPVLREGNVIVLATTSLEVAEACSGIRALVSLLTLGVVYGYFAESRSAVRVVLALLTVPLAIAANGLRVAGTGLAAHYFGPDAADGFLHAFSGWGVFLVAWGTLVAIHRVGVRVTADRSERPVAAVA